MMARKFKTVQVERSNYSVYLKKAQEFYETMQEVQKDKRWNAMGLNAVHMECSNCVTACIDTVNALQID